MTIAKMIQQAFVTGKPIKLSKMSGAQLKSVLEALEIMRK